MRDCGRRLKAVYELPIRPARRLPGRDRDSIPAGLLLERPGGLGRRSSLDLRRQYGLRLGLL